jgi:hypothetical protein
VQVLGAETAEDAYGEALLSLVHEAVERAS